MIQISIIKILRIGSFLCLQWKASMKGTQIFISWSNITAVKNQINTIFIYSTYPSIFITVIDNVYLS